MTPYIIASVILLSIFEILLFTTYVMDYGWKRGTRRFLEGLLFATSATMLVLAFRYLLE